MTALPSSSEFTASTVTEGQFKTALTDQRGFLAGLLGADGTQATALATLGAPGGGYLSKSAAYTVALTDRGKVIEATGTWTLSLPAAATAGAGFLVLLRNTGSGTITVDAAGAETIDGALTVAFAPGRGSVIFSTGSAWMTLASAMQTGPADATAGRVLTVGASATVLSASPALRAAYGGTANAITLTTGAGLSSVPTGFKLRFMASATNTGATTINVDGTGAVAAKTVTGAALPVDYIRTDIETEAWYDGTVWVVDRAVERGSNANGSYTRWANGGQRCEHLLDMGEITNSGAGTYANPYRTTTKSWTYPAAFSGSPVLAATARVAATNDARRAISASYRVKSATDVTDLMVVRNTDDSTSNNADLDVSARGAWY